MLESPAYRTLSRAAHQVLSRIEIEHAHHGGVDNGLLPVTYQDFEKYGLHPRTIAPALRELAALGFVDVTEKGYGGNADFRRPSLYRLTYRHAKGEAGDGTHEWRGIETIAQAELVAKAARRDANPENVDRSKRQGKRIFALTKCAISPAQSDGETERIPPAQSDGPVSP